MTQEDRELLLKDLCSMLPYRVMVKSVGENKVLGLCDLKDINHLPLPYLRPMSSMTEDERKEYNDIVKNTIDFYDCPKSKEISFFIIPIDWLNAHHFDYRGLIPMGLALKAPEGMYK